MVAGGSEDKKEKLKKKLKCEIHMYRYNELRRSCLHSTRTVARNDENESHHFDAGVAVGASDQMTASIGQLGEPSPPRDDRPPHD